jgi:uncharacterized protein YoxC
MTPEQRLGRVERILGLFAREGRRQREQSREQNERINILIHMSERDREVRQAESHELNEKINILVNSQADLRSTVTDLSSTVKDVSSTVKDLSSTVKDLAVAQSEGQSIHEREMAELRKSQSETDKSLRTFLDSLRKGGNGNSST